MLRDPPLICNPYLRAQLDAQAFHRIAALGAAGVWMGTRFMVSDEAGTHPINKERLCRAQETDAVYAVVFDVGWPGAPHRAMRNSTLERWEAAGRPPTGQRPGEGDVLGHAPDGRPIVRYRNLNPPSGAIGDIEAMSLYVGQSVGLVAQSQPAGEIVKTIADDAVRVLQNCAGMIRS